MTQHVADAPLDGTDLNTIHHDFTLGEPDMTPEQEQRLNEVWAAVKGAPGFGEKGIEQTVNEVWAGILGAPPFGQAPLVERIQAMIKARDDAAALVRLLDDETSYRIGRSPDCEVQVDNYSISRFHAELSRAGEQWSLRDTGSKNGLRVDGHVPDVERVCRRGPREQDQHDERAREHAWL